MPGKNFVFAGHLTNILYLLYCQNLKALLTYKNTKSLLEVESLCATQKMRPEHKVPSQKRPTIQNGGRHHALDVAVPKTAPPCQDQTNHINQHQRCPMNAVKNVHDPTRSGNHQSLGHDATMFAIIAADAGMAIALA